jgi:Tfp pilus assembly PilM family ATPase
VINPLEEYIIDYAALPLEDGRDYTQVVTVVARRTVIDYLKEIFKNTDLQLRAIDVDIFAAQRVLAGNYDVGNDEYVAFVDMHKQGVQFSISRGTEFYLTHDIDLQGDEPAAGSQRDAEHLARLVSKELRRLIIDNKLGKSVEDLRAIYLYGDGVSDRVVEALQNTHNVRIDRANPFKKIKIAGTGGDAMVPSQPEAFVIPVGAALKSL